MEQILSHVSEEEKKKTKKEKMEMEQDVNGEMVDAALASTSKMMKRGISSEPNHKKVSKKIYT